VKKKILISTGGTGGHVIPAEIISDHLKDNYDVILSTDTRGLNYFKSDINNVAIFNTPKLNKNFLLPFRLIKIFFLIFRAIYYLKKKKIKKVISTGGYMSLPICLGAKILNLPIYLLEPNFILGRANKFYLNFSKNIFCYSDKLINFPKKFINKIDIIKPLISKEYYERKKKETKNQKFCILIVGGSQGANFFDNTIKESIIDLSKKFPIEVIQQTSKRNIERLEEFYNKNNIENKIFNFEKNFINMIDKSSLCITRAGATTLAELSIMNKPFIAVPLPSAKDNHQFENAKFYQQLDCCWILNQISFNKDALNKILFNILENKTDYISKRENLKKLNFLNSWNSVNQKLIEKVNEN
jgi:UDP-N-acetylglucosamine--N-acetylmuramyl-(pentapeptide) pyrophosphoryl-undecaprenol N-acetylglucosamine transferase